MDTLKLNNGVNMPVLGLGAGIIPKHKFRGYRDARAQKAIYDYALRKGCALFDTSSAYGRNEEILGSVIKKHNCRDRMFLMVKISNREQRSGNIKIALENALRKLNTDYVDLLLLHWPQTGTYVDSWIQMTDIYREGKARSIGVSNFHVHHLDEIAKVSDIVPAINQFEMHPLFTQKPLLDVCRERNIQPVSYTPLGRMHDVLINSRTLRDLSKKYHKTVPQIILRWNLQLKVIPIPRTTKAQHLDEFLNIFDFSLSDDEMNAIDAVNENIRLRYNPDTCDFSIL
jgi:diketogulonate reductase-like aldo/keto reductase